jgi:aminoglycoside phosphotransferase (APT) family kinase protein
MSQLAKAQTANEIRRLGISSHDVQRFLDKLRTRPDATREEIARREYQALPLLGALNSRNLTLHTFMAENPTFFVEVLCEVFLPANRDREQNLEPSPEARARAQAAYRLLAGMRTIPGAAEDGTLDGRKLMRWIEEVRKLAAERDRISVADSKIGAVLAHALVDPEDKGRSRPHRES